MGTTQSLEGLVDVVAGEIVAEATLNLQEGRCLISSNKVDFLAGFGSVVLTFLAGAEIEPESFRRQIKPTLAIGIISFLLPFLGAWAYTYYVSGWNLQAAQVAGLSRTQFLLELARTKSDAFVVDFDDLRRELSLG